MCKVSRPPTVDSLYANQPSQVWFTQSYLSKSSREFPENDYLSCPVGVLLLLTTLLGSGAARADTGSQIARTLKLKSPIQNNDLRFVRDEARSLYRTLYSELTSAESYVDSYRTQIVHLSNGIFIRQGYQLQTEFRRSIRDEFHGEEREMDFNNQSYAAKEINYWVNNLTRGLIPRFFRSPDELPRDSRLVIFNIFTFKESWAKPFVPYLTVVSDFWVKEGQAIRVPIMSTVEMVNYGEFYDKGFTMIQKPMKNQRFSFVVLLPTERWNLDGPESVLNGQILLKTLLEETEYTGVSIKLPRFKLESEQELIRILESMGTIDLFRRAQADLSGITTTERLYINLLKQGTVLKVDEIGVEAAAATSAVAVPTSILNPTAEFHVDQPFVCFVYDSELHIPLIAARVSRPIGG
ncbi:Serpin protein [Fasciola hepatica]|uniref:Serpin protein n=1 Tax=Fasciola hepatica TaxID=6192 RepID=A0A4E0RBU2_FASHE|nr:Serpin protein [Fasciola hepatica]